jgi:uncharacterized integral membrane protein (TIGR00698 family)
VTSQARKLQEILPGVAVSALLAVVATALQWVFTRWTGQVILESLVLALLLGILWRNTMGLAPSLSKGSQFATKQILEVAVALLGLSVDLRAIVRVGPWLIAAMGFCVIVVIALTQWVGKRLGLSRNTAILLGVGNAICGNSAIVAVAPVLGADDEEVAASIGFTAVLSVLVVLALPLLTKLLPLTFEQYGVVAGTVVYAVPQVLAATFVVSSKSVAAATLTKLTRVLYLTPVVVWFAFRRGGTTTKTSWRRIVPWFMTAFLVLAVLRSLGLVTAEQGEAAKEIGKYLTAISMGAIGLLVDLRSLSRAGKPVVWTVLASLAFLLLASLAVAYGLGPLLAFS